MKITPQNTITINGSHDASVTFIDKNGELRVYEYERFIKKRYAMFASFLDGRPKYGSNNNERIQFLTHLKTNLFDQDIRLIITMDLRQEDRNLLSKFFPNAFFKDGSHHLAQAYCGINNSNKRNSLIISVDGGVDFGECSTNNIYIFNDNSLKHIERSSMFTSCYPSIGWLIKDVNNNPQYAEIGGDMSISGKVMGLCAYGNIIDEWIKPMSHYYDTNDNHYLMNHLNIPNWSGGIIENNQFGYDLAATSQYVFEQKLFDYIIPYVEKYNTDVIFVGGCALNVLFNQKLKEYLNNKGLDLYVPPHPNDSGMSFGMFITEYPDFPSTEICLSGLEITDIDNKEHFIQTYKYDNFTFNNCIDKLKEGKIFGIIDGYSEVGPRALGNRSIICYPVFPEMKDILNKKVKFREWFRPFAPVCRIEDVDKYFDNVFESKYMSYAPIVKEQYREKLISITHIDNTCRLQTVEKGCFFYELLTEMENNGLIPIILNTSFNIRGKPILSSLEDAFYVLDNTELDNVIFNEKIFYK